MKKIKRVSKKSIILLVLVLLIAGVATAYFVKRNADKNDSTQSPQGSQQEEGDIDYGPPTEEDKQSVDENKQRIVEEGQQTQTPTGQKRAVTPLITFAEQNGQDVEIGSYVPGIFEDGGECTATFSKGGRNVTKKVTAVKEGNATHCPLLAATTGELGSTGEWSVTVSYNSANATGSSEVKKIEVK